MGCSQSALATATNDSKDQLGPDDALARSQTDESPLVSQDTEYYENQMIDQFDDPMKFYTKSQTILNNVAPDGQDDHLLVKQKSDGSNDSACLPDPSSYDAESEAACRQDSETAYNNPMDYDCDSDSGDFASVKMERADSNFPEAEPCPEADPSPEADFPEADPSPEEDAPEADPSPEEDVHEDEPSPEAPVLETIPSVESAATADYSNADPSPESECGSAKPTTKKSKTLDSKKKRRKHRGAGKTSAPKKQWGKLKKQLSTKKTKGSKAPQKGKRKGKTTVPRRKKK